MQFDKDGRLWNSNPNPGAKQAPKSEVCARHNQQPSRFLESVADSWVKHWLNCT